MARNIKNQTFPIDIFQRYLH